MPIVPINDRSVMGRIGAESVHKARSGAQELFSTGRFTLVPSAGGYDFSYTAAKYITHSIVPREMADATRLSRNPPRRAIAKISRRFLCQSGGKRDTPHLISQAPA